VILFELLAGRLPRQPELPEAVRTIQEHGPEPLGPVEQRYRGTSRPSWPNNLKDEPILARWPTVTYQSQKFSRRHKALAAGPSVRC
jgi:hypothetical protein